MHFSSILIQTLITMAQATSQLQALVYRGPAACDGCPEAVAKLLKSSPSKFNVRDQRELDIRWYKTNANV